MAPPCAEDLTAGNLKPKTRTSTAESHVAVPLSTVMLHSSQRDRQSVQTGCCV